MNQDLPRPCQMWGMNANIHSGNEANSTCGNVQKQNMILAKVWRPHILRSGRSTFLLAKSKRRTVQLSVCRYRLFFQKGIIWWYNVPCHASNLSVFSCWGEEFTTFAQKKQLHVRVAERLTWAVNWRRSCRQNHNMLWVQDRMHGHTAAL